MIYRLLILLEIGVLILIVLFIIVSSKIKKGEKGEPGPMGPMGPMGMRGEHGYAVVPLFEDCGKFVKVKYKIVKNDDELYKNILDCEIYLDKTYIDSRNIKSAKWDSEEEAPNILEDK